MCVYECACVCISIAHSLGVLFLYESYFKIEFAKINVFKCIKMKLCARERIRLCARERIRLCARERIRLCARERIRLCAHARACVFVLIKKAYLGTFLGGGLTCGFLHRGAVAAAGCALKR